MSKLFLLIAVCTAILFSCRPVKEPVTSADTTTTEEDEAIAPAPAENSQLLQTAEAVMAILKAGKYESLEQFMDPVSGILFAPYAYIDPSKNVILHSEELKRFAAADTSIFWGMHDGSGDSIVMSLREYGKHFIYTTNFPKAGQGDVNRSRAHGNMINNISVVFPGCDYIEYYSPGTDPHYEGMDWAALRLVFRRASNGDYLLVAVVHDQWTV